jgi:plastocyanin
MKPDVRDRLVLPILIPVGLLAVIGLAAVGFGMLLLFNPIEVSLVLAIVVAGAILAAFGLASSQSERDLTRSKRAVIVLAGVAPILVAALVATDVLATTAPKVAERECEYCIPEDAVRVVAEGIEFEQDEIALPAGEEASILFINQDQGIDHNVAIYPFQGEEPLLDQPVFEGEIFPGAAQRVYNFETPAEPGTYYFNCVVHPAQMTGQVVIE